MGRHRERDGRRPAEPRCGSCGEPVETVVGRHRTMGVHVPRRRAGPRRSPGCEDHVPGTAPADTLRPRTEERRKEPGPPA